MQLASWDQVTTTGETNDLLRELAYWHTFQITEREHRECIAGYINSGDFHSLCNYDLSYTGLTPSVAYHIRQCLAFYSKRVDLDLGIDREKVAYESFVASEVLCQETNSIFKAWSSGRFQFHPDVEAVLHGAQRIIAQCLGDAPSFADLRYRFGPGATTQVKKEAASPRSKLGQMLCCSEDLLPFVSDVLEEMPQWLEGQPVLDPCYEGTSSSSDRALDEHETVLADIRVSPGRLSFVPKNAKTDRGIVVEPMLNSMCQLGVGEIIRQRLQAIGVDIQDQTKNQRLAKSGSLTGDLATLDLSSASDNIAIELVGHLVPVDWFDLLMKVRTGYVYYSKEKRTFKLQKVSSMGNGFTFPLETLIFYALARASADRLTRKGAYEVNVYGDDIIIPSIAYRLMTQTLHAVGFQTNASKSFATGQFRESCGADYLSGTNIRPLYVKGPLSAADLFVMHNFYVRRKQWEPAEDILKFLDPGMLIWGPDGYGDGHLVTDAPLTPYKRNHGWAGYTFETYVAKNRVSFEAFSGDYVFPSYSIYSSPPRNGVAELSNLFFESAHQRAGRGHTRVEPFYTGSPSILKYEKLTESELSVGGCPRMGVTLPGTEGYKRVKVYTLNG